MTYLKPIDIARKLQISTSALRHYESWGAVPQPERSPKGYRLYTNVHLAYFRCLRTMANGFGIAFTCEVLRLIQQGEMESAFWLVNKEQSKLQQEKDVADQTLELLKDPKLMHISNQRIKSEMSIGEVANLTGVQPSAIRHWEKEGLIKPKREQENGYRIFTPLHVRQIFLIRTLRKTVYFLESMKEIVQTVEHQSIERAEKVTKEALQSINERCRLQYLGVHQLVELCKEVGLVQVT